MCEKKSLFSESAISQLVSEDYEMSRNIMKRITQLILPSLPHSVGYAARCRQSPYDLLASFDIVQGRERD